MSNKWKRKVTTQELLMVMKKSAAARSYHNCRGRCYNDLCSFVDSREPTAIGNLVRWIKKWTITLHPNRGVHPQSQWCFPHFRFLPSFRIFQSLVKIFPLFPWPFSIPHPIFAKALHFYLFRKFFYPLFLYIPNHFGVYKYFSGFSGFSGLSGAR